MIFSPKSILPRNVSFSPQSILRPTSILPRRVVFPLLSAGLLLLAYPPFHFFLLPFVALVPLAVAVGSLKGEPGSGRRAAWIGLSFGVPLWGFLLVWVPMVVAPRFSWAIPGYVVQVGLLSGLTALMTLVTHRLHRYSRVPLALAFPLAWVGMEWAKLHFPFGIAFPWLGLGISLTSRPELLGLAELTGEAGVAFWLAAVNGLLAGVVLTSGKQQSGPPASEVSTFAHPVSRSQPTGHRASGHQLSGKSTPGRQTSKPSIPRGPFHFLLLAVAVALGPSLLGVVRARGLSMESGVRVGVVGADVPASVRLNPSQATWAALNQIETNLANLRPGQVDLVVLPEAIIYPPMDGDVDAAAVEVLASAARRLEVPVLFGIIAATDSGTVTNSALLLTDRGTVAGRYDKSRLAPGMEWGFEAGRPVTLPLPGGEVIGPLICYESLFGELARMHVRAGAGLLVNLTSDVWFGGRGSPLSEMFLAQHAAHMVMRAVETRTGVARAANGGVSFLMDPIGRVLAESQLMGGGVWVARVPRVDVTTIFVRTGDMVGTGVVITLFVLLGIPLWGRTFGLLRKFPPPTT